MGAHPLEEVGPLTGAEPQRKQIRAFFALPLDESIRQRLGAHLADCAARSPKFAWVPPANLHITLRFIGWVDRELALGIAERIASHTHSAFRLELGEHGTFNRGRNVRVVWAGLRSGAGAAQALAAMVEEECTRAGLEAEARQFAPHLTLGRSRVRDGAPLPELPPMPELEAWTASELVLFQSHLSRAGATYERIAQIPLTGSD